MKEKRLPDIVYSLVFMMIGIFSFVIAQGFPEDFIMKLGPDFYPELLSVALIILSLTLFIRTILGKNTSKFIAINIRDKRFQKVIISLGLAILYAMFLKRVGFIPITILFLFAFLLLLNIRKPLTLIAVPIVASFALWFVFQKILTVSLPIGLLSLLGY
ncbi:MAG: tripartite tricarboxylate transporter TctB family protein [Sphaerochaetaceae bacterium]|nr:tripartite tricarboxylate transporter TctB family protein [Sphaerochaetaceae bacterium]